MRICQSLLSTLLFMSMSATTLAAQEVNVYSYRQAFLIDPMFKEFTQETGIRVNVKFMSKGIAEKLAAEGKYSPADVILTSEFTRLFELSEKGLVRAVRDPIIEQNIPAKLRDDQGEWFALTQRTRSVYSSKSRVGRLPPSFDYIDLEKPTYKGKICTRSGKHPYNVALVSAMIAHHGEARTKRWLEGVKANLARRPQGNDRAQVKAIKTGLCDYALGNSYYLGKMLTDSKQKSWAESVYINFPGQMSYGTHVNISGMAMAKHAPHPENALRLMVFMTQEKAQHMYAKANFEYPVNPAVQPSELVKSWGQFKADSLPLKQIAQGHDAAIKLLDEVQFDL